MGHQQNEMFELRPEFCNSGIRYLYEKGYLDSNQKIISNALFRKIVDFNNSYLPYVRLDMSERKLFGIELFILDSRGFELKKEVENELNTEVLYFSEALLKYLQKPPQIELYYFPIDSIPKFIKRKYLQLSIKSDRYGFFTIDGR